MPAWVTRRHVSQQPERETRIANLLRESRTARYEGDRQCETGQQSGRDRHPS